MKALQTWSARRFAIIGLVGIIIFIVSLGSLHLMSPGFDWTQQYVSDMANEPLGVLFVAGTFVHGWGNLSLAFGLRKALDPGLLRAWAVALFGLAALSIALTALFPVDGPCDVATLAGVIHRTSAAIGFLLELASIFVFSAAFKRQSRWRKRGYTSMRLSVFAAIFIVAFALSVQGHFAPGVFERLALATLMVWDVWVALALLKEPSVSTP